MQSCGTNRRNHPVATVDVGQDAGIFQTGTGKQCGHGSALGRMDIKHLREHLAAAGATLSGYDEQNRRDDEGK